jgi:hypothetical protein
VAADEIVRLLLVDQGSGAATRTGLVSRQRKGWKTVATSLRA